MAFKPKKRASAGDYVVVVNAPFDSTGDIVQDEKDEFKGKVGTIVNRDSVDNSIFDSLSDFIKDGINDRRIFLVSIDELGGVYLFAREAIAKIDKKTAESMSPPAGRTTGSVRAYTGTA